MGASTSMDCYGKWLVLAEYGRQPWAIYDVLPVGVAASNLTTADLWLSIGLICALYTIFL